jgi:hypothetical protein
MADTAQKIVEKRGQDENESTTKRQRKDAPLSVNVRFATGDAVVIDVQPLDTVLNSKEVLCGEIGHDPTGLKLFIHDKELEDDSLKMVEALKGSAELVVLKEDVFEQEVFVLTSMSYGSCGNCIDEMMGIYSTRKEARFAEATMYSDDSQDPNYCECEEDETNDQRFYSVRGLCKSALKQTTQLLCVGSAKVHKLTVTLLSALADTENIPLYLATTEDKATFVGVYYSAEMAKIEASKSGGAVLNDLYRDGSSFVLNLSKCKNDLELKERVRRVLYYASKA